MNADKKTEIAMKAEMIFRRAVGDITTDFFTLALTGQGFRNSMYGLQLDGRAMASIDRDAPCDQV
jgi:hypothetical protein